MQGLAFFAASPPYSFHGAFVACAGERKIHGWCTAALLGRQCFWQKQFSEPCQTLCNG